MIYETQVDNVYDKKVNLECRFACPSCGNNNAKASEDIIYQQKRKVNFFNCENCKAVFKLLKFNNLKYIATIEGLK